MRHQVVDDHERLQVKLGHEGGRSAERAAANDRRRALRQRHGRSSTSMPSRPPDCIHLPIVILPPETLDFDANEHGERDGVAIANSRRHG